MVKRIINTIDFSKVTKMQWKETFSLISKFISLRPLMNISKEYWKSQLAVYEVAKVEEVQYDDKMVQVIRISGDYYTKTNGEVFEIYDNIECYIGTQDINRNTDNLFLRRIWNNSTYEKMYGYDLIAIALIMEYVLGDAVILSGDIFKEDVLIGGNIVENTLGFYIDIPDRWHLVNYKSYQEGFIRYDYRKNSGEIIFNEDDIWKLAYDNEISEELISIYENFKFDILPSITNKVKSQNIQVIKNSIIDLSKINKIRWGDDVFQYILNTNNVDLLSKIEGIIALFQESTKVRGVLIERDKYTNLGCKFNKYFSLFFRHIELVKLLYVK